MSLTVHSKDFDDPYNSLIESFFSLEFPNSFSLNDSTILEGVTSALIASGQIRFGPAPSPESLVVIREIIRTAIAVRKPIPILVLFGSRKSQLGEPLDVAELFALKQFYCLQKRVTKYYSPGIQVNIRIEDASGNYLFADDGEPSRRATIQYCQTFIALINLLGFNSFIKPVLESSIFDEKMFAQKADIMLPKMIDYLTFTDLYGENNADRAKDLEALGWKGGVPKEQREHYRSRYKILYPGISDYDATVKLARFFSESWARIQLNGSGADPSWGKNYIRVTFHIPIPGEPKFMGLRDIHYRTLCTKFSNTHIQPWRAKGYLYIKEDNSITPKIISWRENKNYQKTEMVFENNSFATIIRADYILETE